MYMHAFKDACVQRSNKIRVLIMENLWFYWCHSQRDLFGLVEWKAIKYMEISTIKLGI